jgi:hypothetical protein
MTISPTTRKYQYNGNGVTTIFAYNAIFYNATDLVVTRTQISTGVDTLLVNVTDYTITGGNGATGSVTAVVAPTNDQRITITSALPNEQQTDFKDNEPFRASEIEDGLDKLTVQVQELNEKVGRSIQLKATTTSTTPTFPEPVASEFIRWNAGATNLETFDVADLSLYTVSAFMETLLDDTTAAAARTTLGAAPAASPTLTGTVTTDTIQTSGSSGVVIKNSGGTTVATIGPTNTTNVAIAGGLTLGNALGSTNGGTGTATYTTGDILYASATNTLSKLPAGTNGQVLTLAAGIPSWSGSSANFLQLVRATTATDGSTTSILPADNTIPQNTEGTEVTDMACAITPLSASSTLIIDVVVPTIGTSTTQTWVGAIFVDSTANALAAGSNNPTNGTFQQQFVMRYIVASGSTTARTYKFRYGTGAAGTVYFLRGSGAQFFSTAKQASMTVTEVL